MEVRRIGETFFAEVDDIDVSKDLTQRHGWRFTARISNLRSWCCMARL